MRVVVHAERVRHRQEQRVGGGDCFVRRKFLDQRIGFGGVRGTEDGARVGVDVADVVLVACVLAEVGAVAVVDERKMLRLTEGRRVLP